MLALIHVEFYFIERKLLKKAKSLIFMKNFLNFYIYLLSTNNAALAQWIEHQPPELRVTSSSPVCRASRYMLVKAYIFLFFFNLIVSNKSK